MSNGSGDAQKRVYLYYLQAKKPSIAFIIFWSLLPAAGTIGVPVWAYGSIRFFIEKDTTIMIISIVMLCVSALFMLIWRSVLKTARQRGGGVRLGIGFTATDFVYEYDYPVSVPVDSITGFKRHAGSHGFRGLGVVYRDESGKEKDLLIPWFQFNQSTDEIESWVREHLGKVRRK